MTWTYSTWCSRGASLLFGCTQVKYKYKKGGECAFLPFFERLCEQPNFLFEMIEYLPQIGIQFSIVDLLGQEIHLCGSRLVS